MSKRFQFKPMYDVIRDTKASCADCGGRIDLLSARCLTKMPAFYLGACGFVGEVGVGPVRKCRVAK